MKSKRNFWNVVWNISVILFFQQFLRFSCASTNDPFSAPFHGSHVPQKVHRGHPSTVVEVAITDKSIRENSFPHLKFVNDSSEFHDEDEHIAKDRTLISGVASRFIGKRSARSYPSPSYSQLMMMTGGNPYNIRSYNRFNRFDNRRNGLDMGDGSSSSSPSSWGGQWFNKLRRRTSMMMNPMMSQMQMLQSQGSADEPDMAATFLGGGGGGGGGGWGSSHYGGGKGNGVNKSAVGLLGFLSLLSLIQNVLNQTQTMQGRRRRDVNGFGSEEEEEPFQFGDYDWDQTVAEMTKLTPYILPMLDAVTYAQNGDIPLECTLQPICLANKAIVQKLDQDRGRVVGHIISEALSKTLKQAAWRWKSKEWDVGGKVVRAGKAGRSGKVCGNIYQSCPETSHLPSFVSPKALISLLNLST